MLGLNRFPRLHLLRRPTSRNYSVKPGEFKKTRLALWDQIEKETKADHGTGTINLTLPDGSVIPKPRGLNTLSISLTKQVLHLLSLHVPFHLVWPETVLFQWSMASFMTSPSHFWKTPGEHRLFYLKLTTPFRVEILNFNSFPHGRTVFWHSSAHILGQAIERFYENQVF